MKIENGILLTVSDSDIVDGRFIIPDSVKSIGNFVFSYCRNLTSITIPDSVTSIGDSAFYGCSGLTSITIPDSVKSIGYSVFRNCSSLTSVNIGNGVTSIGGNAFLYCTGLTSVNIGNGVTSIGEYAFDCCYKLTSITIPDSVTSINSSAFYGCSGLTSKKANYKAFRIKNGELYCRNKEYKEGIENSVQGALELCQNGIHYCTNLFEIFDYYHGELDKDIAIYEIEIGNEILTSGTSKCCTNSCILKKRLYKEDIIKILSGVEND